MAIPSDPGELRRLASTFGGLAHPTRLLILEALRDGQPMSPKQLSGHVTPPTSLANVAHHTRELAGMGALARAGTRPVRGAVEHFYRLSPRGRELVKLMDLLAADGGGRMP
jgi:DNA-binding transcriptional ArsR family regulator